MISVVLVDDQTLVPAGLQRILASDGGFSVVAECCDGAEAIAAIAAVAADVVVMDVRMRGVELKDVRPNGLHPRHNRAEPAPVLLRSRTGPGHGRSLQKLLLRSRQGRPAIPGHPSI